jgi:hypothetical protein
MKFQEHGYIRGYYPRENYCIRIHEYVHGYIHIRVSMRSPNNKECLPFDAVVLSNNNIVI